jgi:hypothetical protein
MGPHENPTRHDERQAARARKRSSRRPRTRGCLLKGCEQRFRPRHARQRYCSDGCREAARTWSEWKAQQKNRVTAACKQKRSEQSRRYRERVKDRKPSEKEAVPEAARVIPKKFFRRLLQPARLLRMLRALAAIATATVLLAGVPACDGACLGTRAALAQEVRQASPSSWKVAPRAAAVNARLTREMSLPY